MAKRWLAHFVSQKFFCAPSAVWFAYRLATGTQMQLTNKLFNMGKKFLRMPKGLLVRLHPACFSFLSAGQSNRMACAACGVSGCRRILFGAVEVCLRGLFVLRFAAQLLYCVSNAACGGNFSIGLIGVFSAHSHVSAHVLTC